MTDLVARSPEFNKLFVANARPEPIADGFIFTEGPIWHPDDHWLVFSDIIASRQYRWSEQAGLEVFRQPSNMANGNCFDTSGRIVTCEHATSRVVRLDHDGRVLTTLASHFEGRELNSPNDIVCDSKGRLWFTDPAFGRIRDDVGLLRDQELDFQGVYRLDPDGTLTLVVDNFLQPNGLCLSLDEGLLYINDSADPSIRRFDIDADGSLSNDTLWARVEGEQPDGGRKWVPDGMKIAECGHLFCNGPGGVHVFTPDGEDIGTIPLPEKSTNFCFGGPDRNWLFITASSRVYRIATTTSGAPMIAGGK